MHATSETTRLHALALALACALATPAATAERYALEPAWETPPGLANPESALYDAAADVIYVSNVNGGATDLDGNGFISLVTPDGRIAELKWVEGLHAPKGLGLAGGKLYVADLGALVEIDVAHRAISQRYPAPESKFLNDVAIGPDGAVYVSDMLTDTLYRLQGGRFEPWVTDEALTFPNGLHAEADRLVVAAWGVIDGEGFATSRPGHLKAVSYADGGLSDIGTTPIGNLDGLEPDGAGGYLATDWMAGKLLAIDAQGNAETLLTLTQGTADIGLIPERDLVLIPMMNDGKLAAYRLGRHP